MCIFGVPPNDPVEVFHRLYVELYHLVSFRPFVQKADVSRDPLYAPTVRKNRFLKFLDSTIGQTHMVENISFKGQKRLIFQCNLEYFDTLLVFGMCVVRQPQLIQHLRVILILSQCFVQILGTLIVFSKVVIALGAVFKEFYVGLFL